MAPRNSPLARARKDAKQYREDKRKHRQLCRTCTQFTGTRARWCDEGWAIEQAIRRAESEVDRLAQAAAGQGVLL